MPYSIPYLHSNDQPNCQSCKKIKTLFKAINTATPVDMNTLTGSEMFPIATAQGLKSITLGQYAQAIGGGGGGGGVPSHSIAEHNNVVGNPQNGDVLTYNNGNWQPSAPSNGGATVLNDLTDVDTSGGAQQNNTLLFDSNDNTWKPGPIVAVTSVEISPGVGISVTGSPITSSGTITIENTAPDQVVSISSGNGISVSGSYPSFTVENTATDQIVSISSGTGIDVTGSYPNFTIANSQTQINGNGFVKASGTNITYDNSTYATTGSLSSYVPYNSATGAVNLGDYNLTVSGVIIGNGAGTGKKNISLTTDSYGFFSNTTGENNVVIGTGGNIFTANTIGSYNSALGFDALPNNTEGQFNIALGTTALNGNTTGSFNLGVGYSALANITTANNNIGIGKNAGSVLNNNNNNTSSTNSITIGTDSKSNGSNTTVIGNDLVTHTRLYGSLLLGTNVEQPSAILTVSSSTQGFLPPRMSGAQAEAIVNPAEGLMVYSTDGTGVTITSKGWWGFDGTNWVKLN
jgi:hypothetical protein